MIAHNDCVCPKFLALFLFALLGVTGCGEGASVVPAEGLVTLDGKAFANVKVLFYVSGGGPETNFTAVTNEDGRFTLASLDGKQSGVTPGDYSVSLTTNFWASDAIETDPAPRERVAPNHRNHKFNVPLEGTSKANFELTSK